MSRVRLIWLGVAAFVLVIIGANVHLAYVAFASASVCVDHTRLGEAAPSFSAAKSSCLPERPEAPDDQYSRH